VEAGMTHVQLDQVSKRFGGVRALQDISLTVGPSVTGLLGPNGAGKTTLMRLAATVLAPDSGKITILGSDPTNSRDRVEIRRQLGYLPQEPGFYRNFSVFDFVDYVAVLKDMADRRWRHDEVHRVLALVGLEAVAHRRIATVSGGMRRRVALAQALLGAPQLVVLDEPTAGLDPEQRLRFREVISQLPNRPVVLLSTHQTDDVIALCQRVIVLIKGQIRFDGTPAELADAAAGRVWVDPQRDAKAVLSWQTGEGHYRHIGDPPAEALAVPPTIDDAYLLMTGGQLAEVPR
jgi:ABC-2 type transport system ATP-binding protein